MELRKFIFKKKVIDVFIDDYNRGLTPNPCVLCNRLVKFNFLYENMIKYMQRLEKQAEILAFATIMFPFVVAIGVTAENEISELYIAI